MPISGYYGDLMLINTAENCGIPNNIDGFAITSGIRRIAHEYGGVKTFRAYWPLTDPITPKLLTIRSDLQVCGVSVIDCPHNGKKDTADKMMLGELTPISAIEYADGISMVSGHAGICWR